MPNSSQASLVREASALVEARTGLSSQSQQRINLEAVLGDLSDGDLAGFVRTLHGTPDSAPGWQRLMRALVIGETYFFRHRTHFDLLSTRILPEIISSRPNINIWSAGCATGEETYSIAVTLHEYLPSLDQSTIRLMGTDINAHSLDTARRGIYRTWAFRGTENNFEKQYFDRHEGGFQIKPFIRSMVTFRQTNLLAGSPIPQCQVIFCCNVLLYFQESVVKQVEDVLFEALSPGGWLILGPAEAARHNRERWITHIFPGAVVYQKPDSGRLYPASGVLSTAYHNHQRHPNLRPATPLKGESSGSGNGYNEAVECFRVKQYDTAEQILKNILTREPDHVAAHTLYACLFANRGLLIEAEDHLGTALNLEPLYADAYYLRGVLLLETAREAAIESFRSAIYCQRGHPLAAMILGNVYARDGNVARARRIWETALQVLEGAAPETTISDLSDLTVESVASFLRHQLQNY